MKAYMAIDPISPTAKPPVLKFTTRVLLHEPIVSEDYENLHQAMEDQGFSRTIVGADEKRYDLPQAEYNLVAPLTAQQVLEKAKTAAEKRNKNFAVLVTEGTRVWSGLTPTKPVK